MQLQILKVLTLQFDHQGTMDATHRKQPHQELLSMQRKEHKYESPLIYILEQTQKIKSMDLGPTIYINSSTLSIL